MNLMSLNNVLEISVYPNNKYSVISKTFIKDYLKSYASGISEEISNNIIFCSEELLTNIIEHNKSIKTYELIKIKVMVIKNIVSLIFEAPDNNPVEYSGFESENFKRNFKGAGFYLISKISSNFTFYHKNGTNSFNIDFNF
ncbi:hypothetical protein KA977_11220 [Candidatus Dependentiae bacterium]|nr:hypothetical protein [Candidatus Dependentiae bacterium]